MQLSPLLLKSGLPHSVLSVLTILSGGNQLRALQLMEEYKRNVLRIDRLQIEAALRERTARLAIAAREPVAQPKRKLRVNVRELKLREAQESLLR